MQIDKPFCTSECACIRTEKQEDIWSGNQTTKQAMCTCKSFLIYMRLAVAAHGWGLRVRPAFIIDPHAVDQLECFLMCGHVLRSAVYVLTIGHCSNFAASRMRLPCICSYIYSNYLCKNASSDMYIDVFGIKIFRIQSRPPCLIMPTLPNHAHPA